MSLYKIDLSTAKSQGDIVAVSRNGISDYKQQAQVVDYSTQLVLLLNFSDFTPDGYLLIRRKDISIIESRTTDQFQSSLLKEQGVITGKPINPGYGIDSFYSALQSIPDNQIVIVQEEIETKTFAIGVLRGVTATEAAIHCFTGAGNWEAEADITDISSLTCIQMKSLYITPFQRHFDKNQSFPKT